MNFVLDSSVIIGALVESEKKHLQCRRILEKLKNREFVALESYIVLVEVVSAIRRRTGSMNLAERIKIDLQNIGSIYFLEFVSIRAEKAAEIAKETGLKGMDSIIVQIAQEFNCDVVSLDEEILNRGSKVVGVKNVDDF